MCLNTVNHVRQCYLNRLSFQYYTCFAIILYFHLCNPSLFSLPLPLVFWLFLTIRIRIIFIFRILYSVKAFSPVYLHCTSSLLPPIALIIRPLIIASFLISFIFPLFHFLCCHFNIIRLHFLFFISLYFPFFPDPPPPF